MSDPTKAHEASPGVVSMMRLMVRRAVTFGVFLGGSGVLLAFGMLIAKSFDLVPVAVALIAGGPGLVSTALAWKAWQAQAEEGS